VNRDLRSNSSSVLAVLLLAGTACAFARDPESVKMSARTYRISGTVSGDSVAGIAISLTGDKAASATTDASGKFSFTGIQNGHYTIAASQSGYTFQPLSIAITVKDADVAGQNFASTTSATPTFTVSGTVSGDTTSSVTISLAGDAAGSVNTDSSGKFSFAGVQNGHYTIAASRSGYTFQPPSIAVTVQGDDVAGQSFTCTKNPTPTYAISGTVSGDVTSGVTISLTGDAAASANTDSSGRFSFTGIQNGHYTIAASRSGYRFDPLSIAVNVQGADVAGQDFTGSKNQAPTFTVSGTVSGDTTAGVTINLTGDQTATETTDSSGRFSFIVANGSYTIAATKAGFTFAPTSIPLAVNGANVTGQTFTSNTKLTSTVSGAVSGLAASSSLVLRLNDPIHMKITQNGPFTFPVGLTKGTSYTVSVSTQPTSPTQLCTVTNEAGIIDGTDVANIAVNCDTLTAIAAGSGHTCVLTTGGAVLCWGDNASGQLGRKTTTQKCPNSCSFSPLLVQGLPQVKALAGGPSHTCAVTVNGGVLCWGANGSGELGNGSTTSSASPVAVLDGTGRPIANIVTITAGSSYTCAMTATGAVKCWGANDFGQLGTATSGSCSVSCSTVALDVIASGIAGIAAEDDHTCAVTTAGGVKCWGWNSSGQLGATTTTTCSNRETCSMVPLDVPGLTGVTSVQVGAAHTCAITSTGVLCWGTNSDGELGNNSNSTPTTPVSVQNLSLVSALAIGSSFSCALISDGNGQVACWGSDGSGQLGSSMSSQSPMLQYSKVPILVPSLSGATAIAAGWWHACALTPNSGVLCWGSNIDGQLGHLVDLSSSSTVAPVGY